MGKLIRPPFYTFFTSTIVFLQSLDTELSVADTMGDNRQVVAAWPCSRLGERCSQTLHFRFYRMDLPLTQWPNAVAKRCGQTKCWIRLQSVTICIAKHFGFRLQTFPFHTNPSCTLTKIALRNRTFRLMETKLCILKSIFTEFSLKMVPNFPSPIDQQISSEIYELLAVKLKAFNETDQRISTSLAILGHSKRSNSFRRSFFNKLSCQPVFGQIYPNDLHHSYSISFLHPSFAHREPLSGELWRALVLHPSASSLGFIAVLR